MSKKKKYYLFFLILAVIWIVLFIGKLIPQRVSRANNYVGQIGHIAVDNSSDKPLTERHLSSLYYLLTGGTPSPFVAIGYFITHRIEVIDNNIWDHCGSVQVRLYTIFNIMYDESYGHVGCP